MTIAYTLSIAALLALLFLLSLISWRAICEIGDCICEISACIASMVSRLKFIDASLATFQVRLGVIEFAINNPVDGDDAPPQHRWRKRTGLEQFSEHCQLLVAVPDNGGWRYHIVTVENGEKRDSILDFGSATDDDGYYVVLNGFQSGGPPSVCERWIEEHRK